VGHFFPKLTSMTGTVLFAGLATFASASVVSTRSYHSWQQQFASQLQSASRCINTACGPVEYQLSGQGAPVLYAHGTPGGYDQGLAFARFFSNNRCMFIAPSRPGYLRTPLASGSTPEEQADLFAALLDTLHIEKASIIGFSGGGPVALQFALRHPQRCRSLVMIGAIVQATDMVARKQKLPLWQRLNTTLVDYLIVSDPFIYFSLPFTRMLPSGRAVADMFCSGAQYAQRKAGYDNDLAQFATIDDYPLSHIHAPTLIVHGTRDEDVPFADAQMLARTLPNVHLFAVTGGDHTAFYTQARTVMPMVHDFLVAE
jgi:pimeloyl-ACP methyl ester carboxylesterase